MASNGKRALASHAKRSEINPRHPELVTMKLSPGLRSLRKRPEYRVVRGVLAEMCEAQGGRLIGYSVQSNHVHLLVEATDRKSFSRWCGTLSIKMARRLNGLWGRSGKVFAERYHDRALASPREVRNAWRYVLLNHHRHGIYVACVLDPCSSAQAHAFWIDFVPSGVDLEGLPPPVVAPRTYLGGVGWQCHGLLSAHDVPGPRR